MAESPIESNSAKVDSTDDDAPVSAKESNPKQSSQDNIDNDFEAMSQQAEVGLIREFVDFLKYNKKWWLTPIILVLLMVGFLIFLTTTGAAPFLYTFW